MCMICVSGCEEEELCHVSDIRDEGSLYFECVLYPDTRVCGAYDKPLRQACSLVLARSPESTHRKKSESSTNTHTHMRMIDVGHVSTML